MIDLSYFEGLAVQTKENETANLIDRMHLAAFAVEHDRIYCNEDPPPHLARWLAHLWSQSTVHSVNVLAKMSKVFSDDEIRPDAPLSLYKAVMEACDPLYALQLATDYEFRRQELSEDFMKTDKKGVWSSRDVRRFFDIQKGLHYSSDKFEANVPITVWDPATGDFAVTGMPLSGESPTLARVTVQEVLQENNREQRRKQDE